MINDHRGITLLKINVILNHSIGVAQRLGRLQKNGLVKIVFDASQDEEPLVQLTEKGKQEVIGLRSGEMQETDKSPESKTKTYGL
jgi:hypothetical protein